MPVYSNPQTPRDAAAGQSDALMAGALDHLMRYALTGCNQSARHAAYLLDRLAEQPGVCTEMRGTCERMSGALESKDFLATWRRSH